MSDLILSDEQKEFQALAREFAEKEMSADAHRCEEDSSRARQILKQAWEIGLATPAIPEQLGGLGLPLLECCVIAEELGAGCSGLGGIIEASTVVQLIIQLTGNAAQQKHLLAPLAEAAVFAGLDAELFSRNTKVTWRYESESYVLNGVVGAVTNATDCQWFIACARQKDRFAIFMIPIQTEGVKVLDQSYQLGRKAMNMHAIELNNVKLSANEFITETDSESFQQAQGHSYCVLAAGAVGVARSAMTKAVQYSKERQTMGQPISNHQAIAIMLADMAKSIEAARLLVWQSALLGATPTNNLVSAEVAFSFARDSAMAVCVDAVQVFGGYGYSKEYPVEKLMRDAKSYQIYQVSTLETKILVGRRLVEAE